MRVLVTGGTGFIGSFVVEALLRANHQVHCLVLPGEDCQWLKGLKVEIHYGDLRYIDSLYDAVKGLDHIYHLAGVKTAWNEESYFAINLGGTKNLFEACLKTNKSFKRFIYISSQAAAGPSFDGHRVTEEDPCRPITAYGRSKRAAEEYLQDHFDRIPITILRPALAYGPRDTDVWTFFKIVKRGLMLKIYQREQYFNFIHVADLTRGIILAGEHGKANGQIYFITSQERYTWTEITQAVWRILGKRGMQISVPLPVLQFVLGVVKFYMRLRNQPVTLINDKARELLQPYWLCSGEKAKRELGFVPQITLEEGLAETLRWYETYPGAQRLQVIVYR